jgi:hypothetical protein
VIASFLDGGGMLIGSLLALATAAGIAARCLLSPTARLRRAQRRLHDKLALANGLAAAEADALWRLARAAKLAEPAVAFVRPSLLDSGGLEGIGGDVLAALRSKLFGR